MPIFYKRLQLISIWQETSALLIMHVFDLQFINVIVIVIIILLLLLSVDKDANWLLWFETQFTSIAGTDREIDFNGFKTALKFSEARACTCNLL